MTFTGNQETFPSDFSLASTGPAPLASPSLRSPRPLVGQQKACTKCNVYQDLSEFAVKRGSRAASCRSCQKVVSDANYQLTRELRLGDARVRNEEVRMQLLMVRDGYLADSLCESCTGTVDLQLTTRPGYDGLSVHEVVAGARGMLRLEEAVRNSRVLCKTCMGGNYGHAGALAKVRLKMAREAAGRMQGG